MIKTTSPYLYLWFCLLITVLTGCSTTRDGPGKQTAVIDIPPDAMPKAEPKSDRGNPDFYHVNGHRYFVLQSGEGYQERGIASWYGKKFHGRSTSSGEPYNMYAMTAAHKTLPLPSYVEVTNLQNGRKAVLRVNDRGPFHDNRIIDLSYAAAQKLDIVNSGTALVEVKTIIPIQQMNPVRIAQNVSTSTVTDKLQDKARFHNRIFIQIGAFSSRENAERLLSHLLDQKFTNVQIVQATNDSSFVHRVRIGPMHTISATDLAVERLQTLGYDDYRIVVD